MHTSGTYTHGPWTLTKNHWSEPWTATNSDTGETITTGEHHIQRAKDTLPMPETTETPAAAARYTIQPRRTTANPRGWDVA